MIQDIWIYYVFLKKSSSHALMQHTKHSYRLDRLRCSNLIAILIHFSLQVSPTILSVIGTKIYSHEWIEELRCTSFHPSLIVQGSVHLGGGGFWKDPTVKVINSSAWIFIMMLANHISLWVLFMTLRRNIFPSDFAFGDYLFPIGEKLFLESLSVFIQIGQLQHEILDWVFAGRTF